MNLFLDIETFSEEPISNGLYRYFEHRSTRVTVVEWAFDDEPVQVWQPDYEPVPYKNLFLRLDSVNKIIAHNAQFDRTGLKKLEIGPLSTVYSGLSTKLWHCTMVQAYAHGLPGSLDKLGEVLGLKQDARKLQSGKQLVQLFCKPQPLNRKVRIANRQTHPEQWAQFLEYAKQDVIALREVYRRMPNWNNSKNEHDLWLLDQKINERGFLIDSELVHAIHIIVNGAKDKLDAKTEEETEGSVKHLTERDRLLQFIQNRFDSAPKDLRSHTIEKLLQANIPDDLRTLLELRQRGSKTSTSKLKSAMRVMNDDGRIRGALQFNGASRTGRYAGRLFQPQNLTRPTVSDTVISRYREAFRMGTIELLTDNIPEAAADCMRSIIVAPAGKKFLIGDYSNIEGRVLAWLAGEEWKLQAFRDYDEGIGPDLYKLAYAKAFGKIVDSVTKDQRQIGKVMELAFGYGGGVGSLVSMVSAYGMPLEDIARTVLKNAPSAVQADAIEFYAWAGQRGKTYGLGKKTFVACDVLKRLWRKQHPEVANLWLQAAPHKLEDFLRIGKHTVISWAGKTKYFRIRLPSGRYLTYPGMRWDAENRYWYFWGSNQVTRKWEKIKTYGAKLVENITQAVARDVLLYHFAAAEEIGEIVLSVHDEIVLESDPNKSAKDLEEKMVAPLAWCKGLPLAAEVKESRYYRK